MKGRPSSYAKNYSDRLLTLALEWFERCVRLGDIREEMGFPKRSNVGPYLFAAMTLREAIRRGDVEIRDKRREERRFG